MKLRVIAGGTAFETLLADTPTARAVEGDPSRLADVRQGTEIRVEKA